MSDSNAVAGAQGLPEKPASIVAEEMYESRGQGFMGCGGAMFLVAIIGGIIGLFSSGIGGAASWFIMCVVVGGVLIAIGVSKMSSASKAVAARRAALTPEQAAVEEQERKKYREAVQWQQAEKARAQAVATADSAVAQQEALSGSLRTTSGELVKLYEQVSVQMDSAGYRRLGTNLQVQLNDAELQMFQSEEVAYIAAAEANNTRTNIIVVTTARLGVVKPGGVEWTLLEDVTRTSARATVMQNNCELNIWTKRGHYRWPVVDPKTIGYAISRSLGPGKPPLKPMAPSTIATEVARSKGKYMGGTLNYPGLDHSLNEGASVQVVLDEANQLHVLCDGGVVVQVPIDNAGVIIDTTETVGRSLKKGPAALVAGSALLLGPLALLAAPLAIDKKRVKQHLVLALSVGDSNAVISLDDSGAAIRMRAATVNAKSEPALNAADFEDDEEVAASPVEESGKQISETQRDTASTLSELERLKELRESGVLDEEEFIALKNRVLNPGN